MSSTFESHDGQKHAVILSGGGAHGAYEIGVMKALFSGASPVTGFKPLRAKVFTGTSIGGYNAAFMCSQPGIDSLATLKDLEHLWLDRLAGRSEQCGNGVYRFRYDLLDFVNPKCMVSHPLKPFTQLMEDVRFTAADWFDRISHLARSSGSLSRRTVELFDISTYIDSGPMLDVVRDTIDLAGIRKNEAMSLRIAATNWETGDVMIFDNSMMLDKIGHKAVLASAAIPGIFPTVEIMETAYVDGGVVLNTPLKPALQAGATVFHVIYLDPNIKDVPFGRFPNTLETFNRMWSIMMASTVNRDIKRADELNRGMELLQRAERGMAIPDGEARSFVQALDLVRTKFLTEAAYKPVTIHRYRPSKDLGGILGLLNFERPRMEEIIQLGWDDAVAHDVVTSEDVIPWIGSEDADAVAVAACRLSTAGDVTAAGAPRL